MVDFKALHEMEEIRAARWRRTHKTQTTVPLAFKLSSARPATAPLVIGDDTPNDVDDTPNADGTTTNTTTARRGPRAVPPLFVFGASKLSRRASTSVVTQPPQPHPHTPTSRPQTATSRKSTAPTTGAATAAKSTPPTSTLTPEIVSKAELLLKKIEHELDKQLTVSVEATAASKRFSAVSVEPNWKRSPTTQRQQQNDKENRALNPSSSSTTTASGLSRQAYPHRSGSGGVHQTSSFARDSVTIVAGAPSTTSVAGGGGGGGAAAAGAGTSSSSSSAQHHPRPTSSSSTRGDDATSTASSSSHRVDIARLKRMLSRLEPKQKQSFNSSEFYVFGRVLGEGAYGKVKIATHLLTSEKVAVKTFEKSKLADPNSRRRVTREIRILKALSHPNVIKLFEVIDCPTRKYIIMELAPGGDLCKYVRENRRLSEAEACRLFGQIVDGLLYCHRSGIVHRDVKLDNLLMDEQRNIKIVDFGFSVNFKEGQKLRKACGSPSYAAPEIVSRKPYNPPDVDVWSLGVVLYAMICGYFPFQGSNNQDLCRKIVKGRFETPETMSPEARDLIRRMLVADPSKRMGMEAVRQHPWCRGSLSPVQFMSITSAPPALHEVDFEVSDDSQDGDRPAVMESLPEIIEEMERMGFGGNYARHCVTRNVHNITSTSYWLLCHKRNQQKNASALV